ncbi:MAG: hypothetical protein HYR86_10145 [Candidatus Rokubacteria bacterium]|nr:hypothetical protein [Candidatus Rokubacteria bacterium]
MRFLSVLVVCLGSLIFGVGSGLSQQPPRGSEVRYEARWDPQTSGVKDRLNAVHFIDPMVGWAAGAANTILKTTDGGKTWARLTERNESGPEFDRVNLVDTNEGWALSRSVLLHTTDGGSSWQPAAALPGGGGFGGGSMVGQVRYQMKVPTGGAGVFRSADGGATWQDLGGEMPSNAYSAIYFVNSSHGWVSGDYGRFAFTEDGGKTWKARTAPKANLAKVQFATTKHGWMLPVYHTGGPLVSEDGGNTWTSQYAGLETFVPLLDISFLNENQGVLLSGKAVLRTVNGGKTWQTIGKMPSLTVTALSFPKIDEGWVVGEKGYIVHYHLVPVQGNR